MARVRFPRRRPGQWFNKRGPGDVFALTATMAYRWHRRCPCGEAAVLVRDPSGRGEEGRWASAWLDWLTRTHLVPAGVVVAAAPSTRVLEIRLAVGHDAMRAVRSAITTGNSTGEPAPVVPRSLTGPR